MTDKETIKTLEEKLDRYTDLLRQVRSELLEEELITEEEYAVLVSDKGPERVARLESYSEKEQRYVDGIAGLKEKLKAEFEVQKAEVIEQSNNAIRKVTSDYKKLVKENEDLVRKAKQEALDDEFLQKKLSWNEEAYEMILRLVSDRSAETYAEAARCMETYRRILDDEDGLDFLDEDDDYVEEVDDLQERLQNFMKTQNWDSKYIKVENANEWLKRINI